VLQARLCTSLMNTKASDLHGLGHAEFLTFSSRW
jgi:hypothetical protein